MAIFSKKPTEEEKTPAVIEPVVKVAKKAVSAKESESAKSMKELYQADVVKTVVKADGAKVVMKKYGQAYRILVKPIVTEKVSALNGLNKYVFAVDMKANKVEVAKAIMEVYGVKPTKVNIMKLEGKKVRRGRTSGQRKDWKKAIVTLSKGQSINVYEGV